jgi:hypothetical protein
MDVPNVSRKEYQLVSPSAAMQMMKYRSFY